MSYLTKNQLDPLSYPYWLKQKKHQLVVDQSDSHIVVQDAISKEIYGPAFSDKLTPTNIGNLKVEDILAATRNISGS